MRGPIFSRIAAASGIGFVASIATVAILGQVKDLPGFGDFGRASNEVFGTAMLLSGVGAALLLWFVGTLAARLRQLEGGSRRLSSSVLVSGAIISGFIMLAISIVFGARSTHAPATAAIATAIISGPALFFASAVFFGATGIVVLRAQGLRSFSRVYSILSMALGAAYIGGAGLMLFKNYAWINETGYITFLAFTLVESVIGVLLWSAMDEPVVPEAPVIEEPEAEILPARKPVRRAAAPRSRVRHAS